MVQDSEEEVGSKQGEIAVPSISDVTLPPGLLDGSHVLLAVAKYSPRHNGTRGNRIVMIDGQVVEMCN